VNALAAVGLGVLIALCLATPAQADDPQSCTGTTGLYGASQECEYSSTELIQVVAASANTTVRYQVRLQCLSQNQGGICNNPRTCAVPPDTLRYDVLRSEAGGPFLKVGEVCLTTDEAGQLGVITTAMVAREFRRLAWPSSTLVVQPPGGRTLVNFETNFSTTNTEPSSQTVVLLGQQVEIEATPTGWVWHYGDGASETTKSPGGLYPDLEITHTYADAHVVETPSVDTVYTGRYRINGGGWQQIPETLTVPGETVELEVVEAQPVLVGSD
jgi:hypothetical protein